MSGIRQYQRRALEALKPKKIQSIQILSTDEFYLDNQRIYLLGTSEGIGTCSDLKNVNIAVFGRKKPSRIGFPKKNKEIICEWVALLREPDQQELKEQVRNSENTPYLLVERISIYSIEERDRVRRVYFCLTGKKKLYPNTIC